MGFGPLSHLPKSVWAILRELARHALRHPVVGVAAAARTEEGKWLLIRRSDTGTWGIPGGTLEWGETLRDALVREVAEETGARVLRIGRVVGVYSAPRRDPRFHGVTVVVSVVVDASVLRPENPLEVREAKLFEPSQLPSEFAYSNDEYVRDAMDGSKECVFE